MVGNSVGNAPLAFFLRKSLTLISLKFIKLSPTTPCKSPSELFETARMIFVKKSYDLSDILANLTKFGTEKSWSTSTCCVLASNTTMCVGYLKLQYGAELEHTIYFETVCLWYISLSFRSITFSRANLHFSVPSVTLQGTHPHSRTWPAHGHATGVPMTQSSWSCCKIPRRSSGSLPLLHGNPQSIPSHFCPTHSNFHTTWLVGSAIHSACLGTGPVQHTFPSIPQLEARQVHFFIQSLEDFPSVGSVVGLSSCFITFRANRWSITAKWCRLPSSSSSSATSAVISHIKPAFDVGTMKASWAPTWSQSWSSRDRPLNRIQSSLAFSAPEPRVRPLIPLRWFPCRFPSLFWRRSRGLWPVRSQNTHPLLFQPQKGCHPFRVCLTGTEVISIYPMSRSPFNWFTIHFEFLIGVSPHLFSLR